VNVTTNLSEAIPERQAEKPIEDLKFEVSIAPPSVASEVEADLRRLADAWDQFYERVDARLEQS
jgi:hypothetical protein